MSNFNFYSVGVREIQVGLSAIAGLTALPGQGKLVFQHISGGTCFYGGASLALGGSFGLPVPTAAFDTLNYRGGLNFAALGATATVRVLTFFTANV